MSPRLQRAYQADRPTSTTVFGVEKRAAKTPRTLATFVRLRLGAPSGVREPSGREGEYAVVPNGSKGEVGDPT